MTAASASETYNGWSNYPTWAVNLWLSNDEGLYDEARKYAQRVLEDGNKELSDRYRMGELLKDWVRDDLAPDLGATFAADLLGYALDKVDWYEIADSWLEDVSAEVDS